VQAQIIKAYFTHTGPRELPPLDTKFDYSKITSFCANSQDYKLVPSYIWSGRELQEYAKLLKNDPVTTLNFCFEKDIVLHALSLNMQPDLVLAKAITHLSAADAMDIAPFVISQIPT
jgi:hypothetical protein